MPIAAAAAKDGNVYYKTILLLLGQRTQSTPLHQLYWPIELSKKITWLKSVKKV